MQCQRESVRSLHSVSTVFAFFFYHTKLHFEWYESWDRLRMQNQIQVLCGDQNQIMAPCEDVESNPGPKEIDLKLHDTLRVCRLCLYVGVSVSTCINCKPVNCQPVNCKLKWSIVPTGTLQFSTSVELRLKMSVSQLVRQSVRRFMSLRKPLIGFF